MTLTPDVVEAIDDLAERWGVTRAYALILFVREHAPRRDP